MIIMNIGLHRNDGGHVNIARLMQNAMLASATVSATVHVSDTEPTLVAHLCCDAQRAEHIAQIVCNRYAQDAVAFWDATTNKGHLVGPMADEWGPFDPSRFLMMDGRRAA